jgi:hypothetical protein
MEGGYIQQELVECNRLRSVEASSNNNENPAQWTNTLSNIYDLKAGDKVSLYSSFISERGAGSEKTIELKGRDLAKSKTFTYITENVTKQIITNKRIESTVTQHEETIQLKDNVANLIIGYYKNTNGTGYYTLPRSSFGTLGDGGVTDSATKYPFSRNDSASEGYIYPVVDGDFIIKDDYSLSPYSNGNSIGSIYRVKNDNNKFTLFISQYSKLSNIDSIGINGGLGEEPENGYSIDPEFRVYYRYREKLPIEVERGFNSAQFIADTITKKLQETRSIDTLKFSENIENYEKDNSVGNTIISNMIESNTYKTFNCANRDLMNGLQLPHVIAGDASTWYNNFQIVGWKRPELYEYGESINLNTTDKTSVVYNASTNDVSTPDNNVRIFTGDNPIDTSETRTIYIRVAGALLTPSRCVVASVGAQDTFLVQSLTIFGTTGGTPIPDETEVTIEYKNDTFTTESTRLLGCELRQDYTNDTENQEAFKTNILYTNENLLKLKNFINSQELYPEVWESWNASLTASDSAFTYGGGMYYKANTINNTRWFHMNQVNNASTIEINVDDAPILISDTTLFFNYTAGSSTLSVAWNGDENDLFDPNGDNYIIVRLKDAGDPILFTETINITNCEGAITNDHQTLTLETTIGVNLSEGRELQIELTTYENYNDYLSRYTMLGSSNYREAFVTNAVTIPSKRLTKLFLVYYNEDDRDKYYDEPSFDLNRLTYGCFGKSSVYNDSTETYDYYIDIYPNRTDTNLTFPFDQFKTSDEVIESGRKWGYDMHFSAPCNPAIGLFNGLTSSANYYGQTFNNKFQQALYGFNDNNQTTDEQLSSTGNDIKGFINRRYVGADAPRCLWDGQHFSFDSLHTNENLAGRYADGGRYLQFAVGDTNLNYAYITADVPQALGDVVYKINPLQDINEFCPNIIPYQEQKTFYTRNGSNKEEAGLQTFEPFNRCYEAFTIFDSKSGIFFEDMGYDSETWDNGLWGIMGFSYEQFNSNINNRIKRVDNSNVNSLMKPTTNAFIQSTDTKAWNVNENSIPLYTDNIPTTFNLFTYSDAKAYNGAEKDFTVFPPINQKTTSIQLVAKNFPTSMIKGYYTIRSDIVPHSLVVGGRSNITNMPIVGIANKENPQADYFFGGESNLEFTIGKPIKLSSITCSIHDPDGSYANVNNSSSVIFKIQRQVNTQFNIIGEILEEDLKKSKNKKK